MNQSIAERRPRKEEMGRDGVGESSGNGEVISRVSQCEGYVCRRLWARHVVDLFVHLCNFFFI